MASVPDWDSPTLWTEHLWVLGHASVRQAWWNCSNCWGTQPLGPSEHWVLSSQVGFCCVNTCMCLCIFPSMCMCSYMCPRTCMCPYVCVCVCSCMCHCTCVFVYVSMDVFIPLALVFQRMHYMTYITWRWKDNLTKLFSDIHMHVWHMCIHKHTTTSNKFLSKKEMGAGGWTCREPSFPLRANSCHRSQCRARLCTFLDVCYLAWEFLVLTFLT